jgi:hypothetical protein
MNPPLSFFQFQHLQHSVHILFFEDPHSIRDPFPA